MSVSANVPTATSPTSCHELKTPPHRSRRPAATGRRQPREVTPASSASAIQAGMAAERSLANACGPIPASIPATCLRRRVVLAEIPQRRQREAGRLASELEPAAVRGVDHPDGGGVADPDRAARCARVVHGLHRRRGPGRSRHCRGRWPGPPRRRSDEHCRRCVRLFPGRTKTPGESRSMPTTYGSGTLLHSLRAVIAPITA